MMIGDYKKPLDRRLSRGIPSELVDKAREKIRQVTRMLEQKQAQSHMQRAQGVPAMTEHPASGQGQKEWRESLPPVHGEALDTIATDKLGHPLTLRTENGTMEQFKQAVQTDQGYFTHSVRIRVFDGFHKAGYANLTLEVNKKGKDHYSQVVDSRMRINDIYTQEGKRGRGIGALMLERAEELSRLSGAREIYGTPISNQACSFFESRGYQVRRDSRGTCEIFKPIVESSPPVTLEKER